MGTITHVTKGICQSRMQLGEPSLFVNYQEDGENKYRFFSLVFAMYDFYEKLKRVEQ